LLYNKIHQLYIEAQTQEQVWQKTEEDAADAISLPISGNASMVALGIVMITVSPPWEKIGQIIWTG
jgi:hypothetical protein